MTGKLDTNFFLEKKYYLSTTSLEYSFNFLVFLSFLKNFSSLKIIFPFSSNFISKPQEKVKGTPDLRPITRNFETVVPR